MTPRPSPGTRRDFALNLVAHLRDKLLPVTVTNDSETRTYRIKHGTTAKMKRN